MANATRVGEERMNMFFQTLQDELNCQVHHSGHTREAVQRQVERARKKARYVRPELDELAVNAFARENESLKGFTPSLPAQVVRDARHFITTMLERYNAKRDEDLIQVTLDRSHLLDLWRFGPGASNGVKGTHTADKIYQHMTCTTQAEPLVRKLRLRDFYLSAFDCVKGSEGVTLISGSKLATVPKNESTARTIAIEPSGNMCLQLAAGAYLEAAMRGVGLDIRSQQPKNKAKAERASHAGDLATIDLKSASDRISIPLVRSLMPPDWFALLMQIRSDSMQLPGGRGEVTLNMISTMGNGFTFPLMTLLIVALIYGMRAQKPRTPNLYIDWSDTAVFGDDIIVPVAEYADICELLIKAGFIVNADKSYSEGPFRESCGGDYWLGRDITPFYVKRLQNDPDIYVAINQLLEWMAFHNVFLPRSLRVLLSFLDEVFLVPEWLQPYSGIRSSRCPRQFKYIQAQPSRVRLRDEYFAMKLICGGYIEGQGPDMFYTPRPKDLVKTCVRRSRLPKCYLDGADPLTRSATYSARIEFFLSAVL